MRTGQISTKFHKFVKFLTIEHAKQKPVRP
jgi:hypothetical protein